MNAQNHPSSFSPSVAAANDIPDEATIARSRHTITLLWLVINILLVGLIFSSFFAAVQNGGSLSSTPCTSLPPSLAPTRSPVTSPPPPTSSSLNATSAPLSSSNSPTAAASAAPTVSIYDSTWVYDDANAGLVMIWTCIMMVGLSCGGTTVLKSYRTPFVLGGFVGVIIVMANLMLIITIQAEGEVRRRSATSTPSGADTAVLIFAGLEFLSLSWFGYVLATSTHFIIDPRAQPTRFEPPIQANTMTTI